MTSPGETLSLSVPSTELNLQDEQASQKLLGTIHDLGKSALHYVKTSKVMRGALALGLAVSAGTAVGHLLLWRIREGIRIGMRLVLRIITIRPLEQVIGVLIMIGDIMCGMGRTISPVDILTLRVVTAIGIVLTGLRSVYPS